MASSTVVQELVNLVTYKTDKGSQREAKRGMQDFGKSILVTSAMLTGLLSAGLVKTTLDFAQQSDASLKAARNLGLTVEAYQELKFAADGSGVSQEQFNTSLQTLRKTSSDAARGSKELAKDYATLGIHARAFSKLSPDKQLELLADRLQRVKNPADRAALSMRLMGEGGAFMTSMLAGGSKGLKEMRQEARDTGAVVSKDVAEASEKLNGKLQKLRVSFIALRNPLSAELIPVLSEAADVALELIRSFDQKELSAFAKMLGGVLRSGLLSIIDVLKFLKENIEFVKAAMFLLTGPVILGGLAQMVALIQLVVGLFTLANIQIAAMLLVFALIGLAFEDLWSFINGKPSMIEEFLGDPERVKTVRKSFQDLWKAVKAMFSGDFTPISDWAAEQGDKTYDVLIDAFSDYFKDSAKSYLAWQEDLNLDTFNANLKRDLGKAGEDFKEMYAKINKVYREFLSNFRRDFRATIDDVSAFIDRLVARIAALFESVKGFAKLAPGNAFEGVKGLVSGASRPALDFVGQAAKTATQTVSTTISRMEVNINGTDLSPAQLQDATQTGVAGAIAEENRRAALQYNGGLT